jgi:hypothetical protein
LNASATCSNEAFDRGGPIGTSELLLFCLASFDHWDRQQIRVHARVHVQDLIDFFGCFFRGGPGGVTFLPEKFACTEKWLRILEFPSLAKHILSIVYSKEDHVSQLTTTLFH